MNLLNATPLRKHGSWPKRLAWLEQRSTPVSFTAHDAAQLAISASIDLADVAQHRDDESGGATTPGRYQRQRNARVPARYRRSLSAIETHCDDMDSPRICSRLHGLTRPVHGSCTLPKSGHCSPATEEMPLLADTSPVLGSSSSEPGDLDEIGKCRTRHSTYVIASLRIVIHSLIP